MVGRRVVCVVGTRPEAIKMAPVVLALRDEGCFDVKVLATGQHAEMLDQALGYFGLVADVNLHVMKERQSLDHIASSVLTGAGAYFDNAGPDVVLVHGDTTTTFASAVAAFYRKIPVGHVEAGLRSGNMACPFPEEMHRVLTDRITDFSFAPTELARENLIQEGTIESRIWVTGNTVIDSLKYTINNKESQKCAALAALPPGARFLLATAHRRESWGNPLEDICSALCEISDAEPDLWLVVPMHRNPAVREVIKRRLGKRKRVILCPPLDYPDFVRAMDMSEFILSDSGGVQEEASSIAKPVLILRDVTERPEAVSSGSGILVGVDKENIVAHAMRLLKDRSYVMEIKKRCAAKPFGDGRASVRIAAVLKEHFA